MGFWSRLVTKAKNYNSGFEVSKPEKADLNKVDAFLEYSNKAINDLLTNVRNLNVSRELLFVEYDVMAAETRCAKALEMYADLATQRDPNHGNIFSVVCEDKFLKEDIEMFLDRMNMDTLVWDIAYDLCKFGNVFFKVYLDETGKDISSIMQVDDPSTVCDLYYMGKSKYFIESVNRANGWITAGNLLSKDKYNIYDNNGFVHFKIHSTKKRDTVDLEDINDKDENGNPIIRTFKIMDGESIIEKARLPFRMLQPMEDSLIANTIAKADFVKIANVEVGNASEKDVQVMINRVKKALDAGVQMDTQNGQYYAYKHYRGYGDWLVNATKGGINAIDIKPVGGDINVKDLAQMDYVEGLYYVGLGIPKPLLGREESIKGGLGSEGTFAQLDKEVNRRVRKVSDALCYGIEDLVNIWLRLRNTQSNLESIDSDEQEFKIVYNNPSTDDAYQNLKELKSRLDMAAQITQTISSVDSRIKAEDVLQKMCNLFVPFPQFNSALGDIITTAKNTKEENTSNGIQPQVGTGEGGMSGGRGGAINLGGNINSRSGNTPSPASRSNGGATLPRPSQSGGATTSSTPSPTPNIPTEV